MAAWWCEAAWPNGNGACTCADVDAISGVTLDDVAVFVEDLLTGGICP